MTSTTRWTPGDALERSETPKIFRIEGSQHLVHETDFFDVSACLVLEESWYLVVDERIAAKGSA